jgi:hypothetical protein
MARNLLYPSVWNVPGELQEGLWTTSHPTERMMVCSPSSTAVNYTVELEEN